MQYIKEEGSVLAGYLLNNTKKKVDRTTLCEVFGRHSCVGHPDKTLYRVFDILYIKRRLLALFLHVYSVRLDPNEAN